MYQKLLLTGMASLALLGGSSAEQVHDESFGILIMDTENTVSPLGLCQKKTESAGFSGSGYLEFTGNEYDMGINMTGWLHIRVNENRGTEIKMRFAELLMPDGKEIDTASTGVNVTGSDQTEIKVAELKHGSRSSLIMSSAIVSIFSDWEKLHCEKISRLYLADIWAAQTCEHHSIRRANSGAVMLHARG